MNTPALSKITRAFTAEAQAELQGYDAEDITSKETVACEWCDGASGYYEVMHDGTLSCTVHNDSETFTSHESAQEWLYSKVKDIGESRRMPSAGALAIEFNAGLLACIGEEKFSEVCRLNKAESSDGICHSHDFCDANEVMLSVFEKHGLNFPEFPASSDDAEARLWNAAWDLAKQTQKARA